MICLSASKNLRASLELELGWRRFLSFVEVLRGGGVDSIQQASLTSPCDANEAERLLIGFVTLSHNHVPFPVIP